MNTGTNKKARCFLACFPPLELRQKLASIRQDFAHIDEIRWTPLEQIHLTIQFLGYLHMDQLESLTAALKTLQHCKIQSEVEGLGAFPNLRRPAILWAGLKGNLVSLQSLHQTALALTQQIGVQPENRPFQPHLTLARLKTMNSRIHHCVSSKLNSLVSISFGTWTISEIVLMQSHLSPAGARYECIVGTGLH